MARPTSKDPLDRFRWTVEIDDIGRGGFSSVQTPSYSISTNEYKEGGAHLYPKQIVDSIRYEPISLERGVTSDDGFLKWAKGPFQILNSATNTQDNNNIENYRRDVIISHMDRAGSKIRIYRLFNAIPIEYKPASDFGSDIEEVSLERIVIAYEGFEVQNLDKPNDSFSTKNIFQNLSRNSVNTIK